MTLGFVLLPLISAIIGALLASKVMENGRRVPKMMFDLFGIVGCILALIDKYIIMVVGRCLFGLAVGGLLTLAPKIIEETIPV